MPLLFWQPGTWPSYICTLCLCVCVQCWLVTIALRAHAQHWIGGGDDQAVDNQSEEWGSLLLAENVGRHAISAIYSMADEYWILIRTIFIHTVLMYVRAIPSQWACVAHTRFHIGDWLSRVTLSLSASCFDLARLLTCLLRPRLASQSWDCVHLAASDDNLRMVELDTILSRFCSFLTS